MTLNGYLQLALYMVVLIALAKPLGWYMARVYEGQSVGLNRVLGPLERLIYRLFGTREDAGDELEAVRDRDAAVQSARLSGGVSDAAGAGGAAAQPAGAGRGHARLVVQHRRPASPPTPTGRAMAAK